jgi:hypothetical protein
MTPTRKNVILKKLAAKQVGLGAKLLGSIAGAPVRGIGRALRNIAIGRPVKGRSALRSKFLGGKAISKSEYSRLKGKGKTPVWKTTSPEGHTVRMKERYGPGGIAGWAIKHPILATGGTLGGYTLLKGKRMAPSVNVYNQPPAQQEPAKPEFINWG